MRSLRMALAVTGMVLAAGSWSAAYAQKKTTCKDVPLRWFISDTATLPDETAVLGAIQGDGDWYSGGSNNVIHVCGTSPSFDATIVVGNKRKVAFSFGMPLTGSVVAESVAGGTYYDSPFMNVRNLLCAGCADASQPFTTRMAFQLGLGRENYRLRFMPPVTDSPDLHTNPDAVPAENTPYETSPVLVIPQPYDCMAGGTIKPSWIVRGTNTSADPNITPGENLQVGTLSRVTSSSIIHAGQYSMPFEMRIEALTCFAAY